MQNRLKIKKRLLGVLALIFLPNCTSLPHSRNVPVCVVDVESNRLWCSDKDNQSYFVELKDADNFLCVAPNDAEGIL